MVWVNLDKPTKRCTIHSTDCRFVLKKQETRHKGLGKLKRDGGWLYFETVEEAEEFCNERYPDYKVSRHC